MTKRDQIIGFVCMFVIAVSGMYVMYWAYENGHTHVYAIVGLTLACLITILHLMKKYRDSAEAECSRLRGELEANGLRESLAEAVARDPTIPARYRAAVKELKAKEGRQVDSEEGSS
jgi:hypothetical protein